MAPQTEVLTLMQVAEWLQVSPRTVLRLMDAGTIQGLKIGHQWRFRSEDIEAYLNSLAMSGINIDRRRTKEARQEEIKRTQHFQREDLAQKRKQARRRAAK
jgi:excisionase family DNA binding protein